MLLSEREQSQLSAALVDLYRGRIQKIIPFEGASLELHWGENHFTNPSEGQRLWMENLKVLMDLSFCSPYMKQCVYDQENFNKAIGFTSTKYADAEVRDTFGIDLGSKRRGIYDPSEALFVEAEYFAGILPELQDNDNHVIDSWVRLLKQPYYYNRVPKCRNLFKKAFAMVDCELAYHGIHRPSRSRRRTH